MRKRILNGLLIILSLLVLTAAVLCYLAWDETFARVSDRFINLVTLGWFSFVLARFVALFLILLGVRRLWRWRRIVGASVGTLLIISLTVFAIIKSNSPAGIYTNVEQMPIDYDGFWLLENGQVKAVRKEGVSQFGQYEKTADGWILTRTQGADQSKLKFSVFGLYLTKLEDPQPTLFLPRRIIPFVRPKWMPDWLQ